MTEFFATFGMMMVGMVAMVVAAAPKSTSTKAHTIYKKKDGKRVASVTTILAQLGWNKSMLIAWARREALAGEDPDKIRDEAAAAGTCAHYLVECHLKGLEPDMSRFTAEQIDFGETAFLAFLEWEKQHDFKAIEVEKKFVSDTLGYGGTIDCVCEIDGRESIMDLKTSKGVYPEMRVQLAAYLYGHMETSGLTEPLPCYLLRIDKHSGEFEFHKYETLKNEWKVFLHCLELHKLQKQIGR